MKVQTFTRHLTEESTGYAKLKSKKFRKIRYNEAEKAIMENKAGAAIAGVSVYFKDDPDLYEESYYKTFEEIKTQKHVEYIGSNDFEVFYSFSGALRGNRKYGNANWSARFLYEFLCERFNGGERFVDTYLNTIFTSRPVYAQLTELVESIQSSIEEKWNDGNLRGGQWGAFYRFQSSQMDYLQRSLSSFSRAIRDDIILCLSIGLIPLRFSLAQSTVDKRISLDLQGDTPFYATSWLINQLEVHVILGDSNTGMMFYSDTYKGAS